jgi:aminoglycoside 2''-phosphotransferase
MDIPAHYLDRILALYPELIFSSVYADADGLVNDVYIINNELVCRFPKDEEAQASLIVEADILDLARKYLDMLVPLFEHREPDFVVYRMIQGEPLYRHDILGASQTVQNRFAEQLATFLRQLHSLPIHELRRYAIPHVTPAQKLAQFMHFYTEIEQELFPFLMTMAKDWVKQLFEPVLSGKLSLTYTPALIHDDLAPYHILYDKTEQRVTGVIDFGTGSINDPASDFALLINAYGESILQLMIRYYPAIEEALERARFYAGTLELGWALTGIRTHDVTWLVCQIGRARDVMPIGYKTGGI